MNVFDRKVKTLQRDRASRLPNSSEFDYLKTEISKILVDRLDDIKTDRRFSRVLDLGAGPGYNLPQLQDKDIDELIMTDISYDMLARDEEKDKDLKLKPIRVCASEESLPFADKSFDMVISNCQLHWVNDLPGTFKEVRRVLKDDGVFLCAIFGEGTLLELRNSLILAETEREGGVSPHVSPLTNINDIGNLLTAAGFKLTTLDSEVYKIEYENPFILMHDLRCMGESNADLHRKPYTHKDTLMAASAIYQSMYADPETGIVPASFSVIYMIGWTPHESQPKPSRRGSAKASMHDIEKLVGDSMGHSCSKK
eukprot:TRINITY_DN11303_c0_g1_i1.p1 TRINITY_DN11303_c0_g1~~TRINITY_DN11303_c0_g1_i1.p1  ORF type:complete len:346 (-),score=71.95 TRINITY_DN11303_c0_g1_i1:25-957(-)